MADSLSVRVVENKADFRAFFGFPWRVHADSPEWVPPLLSMRVELLDKEKNPAWSYMEGEYFVAWRGAQPVGTVAAFINHRHNEVHDERIGWFGAFDVLDDQEAATALFDAAGDFVRGRGYEALRGPQTFTTHEECGLLIEGFGRPVLLMPWNPPRYQRHVEEAGLVKYADMYSFAMSREMSADMKLTERLQRITQQVMKRNKITIRPINRRDMKGDFQRFRALYNDAWDRNQGFVPMNDAELDALVASLGQFLDPDFAFFASVDGELAGFVLGIPDLNQVLQKAAPRPGVPEPLTLLRAVWHWKLRPVIDTVRIPLLGVREPFRHKGVDVALYYHILEACQAHARLQHADGGWILESNEAMMSVARNMRLKPYRTHRLYERKLV
ncbi:MAG: hypothetical protein OXG07_10120 [Anaerolineaceae bacterium]|nr:hypothetical protein [Anaerolineaceae bacterium]